MNQYKTKLVVCGIAACGVMSGALSAPAPVILPKLPNEIFSSAVDDTKQKSKEEAAQSLRDKIQEVSTLQVRAEEVTKQIGALASEGKLPTNEEAINLLKTLVQDLDQINKRLAKIEEEIEDINGWIEGQTENLAVMGNDVATLKRPGIGNYVQFQWLDSQENTGDGFQFRRMRVGQNNKIADNMNLRFSFDIVTGSARTAAELRDVHLIYDIEPSTDKVGMLFVFGQQPLNLGYELTRSSGDREFPERAVYNRTLFNGERDRGIMFRKGLNEHSHFDIGIWSGLTTADPEQAATFADRDRKLGVSAGIRFYDVNYDFGISGLVAKRPAINYTFTGGGGGSTPAPEVQRDYIFIDGTYVGLIENLTVRGELMFGNDRVPKSITSSGTSNNPNPKTRVLGWHLQTTYDLNSRNQVHVKLQFFDPDTKTAGNGVQGWGVAYTYWFNPGAKITGSYEAFDELGPEIRNNIFTIRLQYRL